MLFIFFSLSASTLKTSLNAWDLSLRIQCAKVMQGIIHTRFTDSTPYKYTSWNPPGQDKEAVAISGLGDPTLIIINKLTIRCLPTPLSHRHYSWTPLTYIPILFRSASNFNQLMKFVSCTWVPLCMGPQWSFPQTKP